ncbi:class I SAM-dependent methyltransferase [uncultured Cocleimonas sp.]|uniref:class I SAM-dependent methyltransferase n=1 Tax=uncultured Cocleimonas sp. TaxID=1051587 RepID=UPI0026326C84|nr:class I SAM-dependent methyltransferase [uncultured Cocleimonas sp.]
MEVGKYISELECIVKKGGPEKNDYEKLKTIASNLKNITLVEEAKLYKIFKPILDLNSIIGHTFMKPHGYAGDYELIDKIHLKLVSDDPFLQKWDCYYHEADSSTAVRNRKDYFIEQINKKRDLNKPTKNTHILNLGSGPCRDVNEFFLNNDRSGVFIDCVDMDASAIEYASAVCDNFYQNINFINRNAFRLKPDRQYSLIWSSGLFDYFSDKLFVRLIHRMYEFIEEGGEMVIGNFSTSNPGKNEMEVYGNWYLNHRNEEMLIELAQKAMIDRDKISVNSEATGVNLFLHLRK